jgi:shikimate kinase
MGSGKTTAGYKLASRLGYRFIDLDRQIEENEKMSINDIFSKYGESWFRQKEASVLRTLEDIDNIVVSTGGGLPCHAENMAWMNNHGITVYLKMTAEALFQRLLKAHKERPLLKDKTNAELLNYIMKTLEQREPAYSLAQYTVEGKNLDVDNLRNLIFSSGEK